MIGLAIGAACGAVQYWMLSKFTSAIVGSALDIKSVLLAVAQFILPILVLLCCALLFPKGLMWSAIGIAAALIGCSFTRFMLTFARGKK